MNKLMICTLLMLLLAGLTPLAQGAPISAVSATGTGAYTNSPSLLINGVIPSEGTLWTWPTNVWWYGTTPRFTIDLGGIYTIQDVVVQVDNNDGYKVDYSTDTINWNNLFTILSGYGEIGYGMDTMNTFSGDLEHVSGIDFSPSVSARYLRIYATGGDNSYAVSELQAHGTAAGPIPEPSTFILLGFGLLGMAGHARKRMKK